MIELNAIASRKVSPKHSEDLPLYCSVCLPRFFVLILICSCLYLYLCGPVFLPQAQAQTFT